MRFPRQRLSFADVQRAWDLNSRSISRWPLVIGQARPENQPGPVLLQAAGSFSPAPGALASDSPTVIGSAGAGSVSSLGSDATNSDSDSDSTCPCAALIEAPFPASAPPSDKGSISLWNDSATSFSNSSML